MICFVIEILNTIITFIYHRFYNSRFDDGTNINVKQENGEVVSTSKQLEHLRKIAETVANAVYKLASDGKEPKEKIAVSKIMVSP